MGQKEEPPGEERPPESHTAHGELADEPPGERVAAFGQVNTMFPIGGPCREHVMHPLVQYITFDDRGGYRSTFGRTVIDSGNTAVPL